MQNEPRVSLKTPLLISLALVVAAVGASVFAWQYLPANARLAVHWGIDGEPNGYAGKFMALAMLPIVQLIMTAVFALIPSLESNKKNLALSWPSLSIAWIASLAVILTAHFCLICVALGGASNLVPIVITLALGALFVVIGAGLPRIQPNRVFGIRTPWTLKSNLSWTKTHVLGSWLFVLLGLLFCGSVFLPDRHLTFTLVIVGTVLVSLVTSAYSYFVWRGDAAKG